tara:strand:- start:240 stop:812 length:573 start_codon:yes stop_codon:yes gene_type:complete
MRVFITVLFLIFSLQSFTKADDIRDFQIEGMSIGDSLLDYFSKEEIKKNSKPKYYEYIPNFPFIAIEIEQHNSFEQYYGVQFHVKKKDKNFIIYAISGYDYCLENIKHCYDMQKKIEKDISNIFTNVKINKNNIPHRADKTEKSKVKYTEYLFKNGDAISVNVYDWSNAMPHSDNYDLSIDTAEFLDAFK